MKLLSSSFSAKDIECEYVLDKQKYNGLVSRLKERLGQGLAGVLGNEEFRDEVVRKPIKTIKDIKARSTPVFEASKFEELKSSALSYLGGFEMSKHASHHVLSSCLINGAYLATGHADSTLRIWQLNPLYFDTPFSSVAQKKVSNEEIKQSGVGASSAAAFKKKDGNELKADPVVLPFELVGLPAHAGIQQQRRVPQTLCHGPRLHLSKGPQRNDAGVRRCWWRVGDF